jgi:hypothetical protein
LGFRSRSIAYWKVCGVTSSVDGGENLYPDFTVKVYVSPSELTLGMAVAASGTSSEPAAPVLSG